MINTRGTTQIAQPDGYAAFRLQQALGTDAACAEIPTCKALGIQLKRDKILNIVCRAFSTPGSL